MNSSANSNPGLVSNTAQSAKNLAQQAVKQVLKEPLEILKQAGNQVIGSERSFPSEEEEMGIAEGISDFPDKLEAVSEKDRIRSQRLIMALEEELRQIKEMRKQKETQKKKEAEMAEFQAKSTPSPLIEISTKPGRKLGNFFGHSQKSQAQRQQTQTERPLPPSG